MTKHDKLALAAAMAIIFLSASSSVARQTTPRQCIENCDQFCNEMGYKYPSPQFKSCTASCGTFQAQHCDGDGSALNYHTTRLTVMDRAKLLALKAEQTRQSLIPTEIDK